MGYGRAGVSAREQNDKRQLAALRAFGLPDGWIFPDKRPGSGLHSVDGAGAIAGAAAYVRRTQSSGIF